MNWEDWHSNLSDRKKRILTLSNSIFHSTHEGKELLELMKEEYVMQPVRDPNRTDAHACLREGENNLVRLFIMSANIQGMLNQSAMENNK